MKITSEIVLSTYTAKAIEAALAGAKTARAKQLAGLHPQQKSKDADDLVTEGDEAAQKTILDILPRTREGEPIGILAEEKTAAEIPAGNINWRWVIDPIDGTLPYSKGEPFWCVSIALQQRNSSNHWQSRIGVIYQASAQDDADILKGKLFWTEEGRGAFMRDLAAGTETTLSRPALIAKQAELGASGGFGAWARAEFSRRGIATRFRRSICHAATEMLLGSAYAVVQDAGPLEWDVAAIGLIAKEAGAFVRIAYIDDVGSCARYAALMTWDQTLFDVISARLPRTTSS